MPTPYSYVYGFILLTVITFGVFHSFTGRRFWLLLFGIIWLSISAKLAMLDFFMVADTVPPRLAFLILPMLILGLLIGFLPWFQRFRAAVSLENLHYLHAVRVIVELVFLHGLYETGFVARALTYEGYNFDIIPGILLPVVGYLAYSRKAIGRRWVVAANVFGIVVLAWTVVVAVLSAPTSYQQFGIGAPTTAIFYFPYVWLPALVAPLMFWSHFIVLGRLRDEGAAAGAG